MLLLKIAFRNVLRQRRRSLLTCLSMTGGYILCCLSWSLMEGSYNNAIEIFTLDHTGHIQIHKDDYLRRPNIHKTINDPRSVETTLARSNSIVSFTPRVFSPALAWAHDSNAPVQIIGVQVDSEANTTRLEDKVREGQYFQQTSVREGDSPVLIGRGIADLLEAGIGDELVLISQGADGSIANDIFLVQGIVGTRTSWDRQNVYLPLAAAQQFLTLGERVHEYAVLLSGADRARPVASSLKKELPSLVVSPWQEVEDTFYRTMQSDKQGNHFTLGIIVFIVFIGVLNTVLMSVLERTREFGVLKAIGSRPLLIGTMITLETTVLAIFSIVLGFITSVPLIGWFALTGIKLEQAMDIGGIEFAFLQGEFSFYVFVMPAVLILSFAILVSVPPGIRAARIVPRDALESH